MKVGFFNTLLDIMKASMLSATYFFRRLGTIVRRMSYGRATGQRYKPRQQPQKEIEMEKLKEEISQVSSVLLSARAMETLAEHRPKLVENLVLDYLRTHKDSFSLTQCSKELGISQSTLRRILRQLHKKGIISLAPA